MTIDSSICTVTVRSRCSRAIFAAALSASLFACRPWCGSPAPSPPDAGPLAGAAPAALPLPDAVRALREADAAFQAGRVDEAIASAEAAVKGAPGNPVAWNLLGRARAARYGQTRDGEDAKEAREAFSRAVAESPDFWPAFQNLGELNERTGLLQQAAYAYRKVLAAQPGHPDRARFEEVFARAAVAPPLPPRGSPEGR